MRPSPEWSTTGRISIVPYERVRDPRGPLDRLVERLDVDQVVAAEHFLRLRERPVADDRVAVPDAGRVVAVPTGWSSSPPTSFPAACEVARQRRVPRVERLLLVLGTRIPRGLVAVDQEHVLHRYISTSGRTSTEPPSRADGIAGGDLHRVVDRVGLDEVVAAEVLLRLRERAVGGERLAVVDADGLRRVDGLELRAADGGRVVRDRGVLLVERRPSLPRSMSVQLAGSS